MTNEQTAYNNTLDAILVIETGDARDDEIIAAFQYLIDTGIVWQLQGFYGRTAEALIERGLCHPAGEVVVEDIDARPFGAAVGGEA